MSNAVTDAGGIPVNDPVGVVTYEPMVLAAPDRTVDLEIKVSMPETGTELPILLFSHGHGRATFLSSIDGYGPVTKFWAAHGFVVIQPTHLDSGKLGLRETDDPDAPLFWRSRARDMRFILDHLDEIESAVPGLQGRLDASRIAVAGHSLGGHTACQLLGMRVTDPRDGSEVDQRDPRVKAGVAFAAPGSGVDPDSYAYEHYPGLRHADFTTMTGPALIVVGDQDQNDMFSQRLSYRSDAYTLSPGPKSLLTVFGAEHMLGGISGYDAAETSDEDPERVATLRALAWAYLRTALYPGDSAWPDAVSALETEPDLIGRVQSK